MKYTTNYNPSLNLWMVWREWWDGSAEVVKTFKTEKAAKNWIARH